MGGWESSSWSRENHASKGVRHKEGGALIINVTSHKGLHEASSQQEHDEVE